MLLAIWPTAMPSASAACCAVRAASSSITRRVRMALLLQHAGDALHAFGQ